jgi:hypothetical protein
MAELAQSQKVVTDLEAAHAEAIASKNTKIITLEDEVDALKIRNEQLRAETERLETNILNLQLLDDDHDNHDNHNDDIVELKIELANEKAKNADEAGAQQELKRIKEQLGAVIALLYDSESSLVDMITSILHNQAGK